MKIFKLKTKHLLHIIAQLQKLLINKIKPLVIIIISMQF